jgi:hypothetical protein
MILFGNEQELPHSITHDWCLLCRAPSWIYRTNNRPNETDCHFSMLFLVVDALPNQELKVSANANANANANTMDQLMTRYGYSYKLKQST